ncbi:MAG: ABC transporter permease [Candidatus Bipolaricaulota bacterium]|nr:MAG: ABC transporter permease [Candidatus Bipolaricaulota bacterium]
MRRRKRGADAAVHVSPRDVARPVGESYWRGAWRRFRRHRLAMAGGAVLLVFVLGAILSPWITPYTFSRQNRSNMFTSPSFSVPSDPQLVGRCARERVLFFRCGMHPFGTDDLGRDIFARVLHGGRVSLLVGFIAAAMSTLLGAFIGAVAGYVGGFVDAVAGRLIEIMLSIPQLALLLILMGLLADPDVPLSAALSAALGDAKSIVLIIAVIVVFSWMSTARLVRGQILSLRERDFVEAARGIGASRVRVIFRHLMPNVASIIIVQGTLMTGEAILIESGLSFLGFGIQSPAVSWGNMLARAQGFLYYPNGVYIALFPGLFIFLTVLCVNFLGDGLRDALDPRHYSAL